MPNPNIPPQAAQAMMAARARQRMPQQGQLRRPMPAGAPQGVMVAPAAGAPAMKKGGKVKKMATGGYVRAADGCAQRGKTVGKFV